MKGLTVVERIIIESLEKRTLSYQEVQNQTGLQDNICFNVLQALILKGLVITDGRNYTMSKHLTEELLEVVNNQEKKKGETLEYIEAMTEYRGQHNFHFKKVALDSRDEKIFKAMLLNLESFLADAHRKSEKEVLLKDQKVVMWAMGDLEQLVNQILTGK